MRSKLILLGLLFLSYTPMALAQGSDHISTETEAVQDSFYGVAVPDPYRFLENLNTERVQKWLKSQASATEKQLKKLKGRNAAFEDIKQYAHAWFNRPHREGPYYFKRIATDARNTASLFYQESVNGQPVLLVNAAAISGKDRITIGEYRLSKDAKNLAYQFHRDGSDWAEIKVVRMNGSHWKDHLKYIKFSNISWQGNGFYYSRYRVQDSLQTLRHEEVYYHTLGQSQEKDELVFSLPRKPFTDITVQVDSDERFLILGQKNGQTETTNYFIRDALATAPALRTLPQQPRRSLSILDNHGGRLYALMSLDNGNKTIAWIDPEQQSDWQQFVPDADGMLVLEAVVLENYLAVVYQGKTSQRIVFFTYEGIIRHIVTLPAHCALSGLEVNKFDKELIYHYQSYLVPPVVFTLDLETFEEKPLQKTITSFDVRDFETQAVEYPAKDGTLVPMTLVYKKGLLLDGRNPTLLRAYGGFGKIGTPSFEPGLVYFLQKGGVFAFAHVRGGGEKGAEWHRMGRGINKQTCFDDFIAGAEYLIAKQYTSPRHLAITGGSHGGLVVAAAMTQRPELFAAVVPEVGVFDMIRKEKFTIGLSTTAEYGSVKTESGFKQLLAYSPLHRIKPGVNYPPTLILTAENDDRVPPFHSFKFAAALQNNPGQTNPVLLRVEKEAGHKGASTQYDRIAREADIFAFILQYTQDN